MLSKTVRSGQSLERWKVRVNELGRVRSLIAAVHHDAARARAVNACHHVKEGCLAGAVGTDKPHGLAGVDVHLQRVQGHETAEAHGEIRAFKQMCHYALPVYVRGLRGRSPAGR